MSDSVGSVSVEVVPDARGWSEKLRAQIRDQKVTVKADADTSEANAQLDEATRTRTVKIKTDVSQFSQGAAKLDEFIGNLGLLPSLAIAAGSALIPLGAALGGVVAALGAPLAIAGGGATLFALLGGAAIAQTEAQQKKIDALAKTMDSAKASLEASQRSAGKNAATSTAVANAQVRLNKATADYKTALAGLSPQQKGFLTALQDLKNTFTNVINGPTGKALMAPFTEGLTLVAYTFRAILPIVRAAAGAFTSMLEGLNSEVSKPGFEQFVHRLAIQVGPDLVAFGHIAGNALKGISGLLFGLDSAFGGAHNGILGGLEQLSGKFAALGTGAGNSKWLKDFVDYFHKVGPDVASTLQSLARAFGHIVAALAPLGQPVLHIIKGIADAFNSIPIPVLTGIAAAAGGLVAFQKLGGFKAAPGAARLGQNALSALTGGLIPGASSKYGKGVQAVYVTNPGFGSGGPGGGGGETWLGKLGKVAGKGTLLGALTGIGGTAAVGIGTIYLSAKVIQMESTPGQVPLDGHTPADWRRYNRTGSFDLPHPNRVFNNLNSMLGVPDIRSTSTAFDALKAHAQAATRQLDLIGPHVHQTMDGAIGDVNRFQGVLNSIHDKRFQVIADTASAIKSLEALQALRIKDKYFNVYQRNLTLERAVGPGGGIGIHNPPGSASGGSGGGASTGRTPVHIHLDENGRHNITGYMQQQADSVYQSNRAYENARAGR